MPLYVGETVLITHTAEFDGEVLSDAQVAGVTITIYKGTDVVLSERAMEWNEDKARWQYDWETEADPVMEPGGYRVKIEMLGSDGSKAREFKTVRLNRNPV